MSLHRNYLRLGNVDFVHLSTGGIIALGLGVENWRVETCIKHFRRLSDKAFTSRLPGMRFGHKYRTRPFEQALQEIFKDEFLFGGDHDESSSYFTRVAVTATTDTGEKPVILTNYNREMETQRKHLSPNFIVKLKRLQRAIPWSGLIIQSTNSNFGKRKIPSKLLQQDDRMRADTTR